MNLSTFLPLYPSTSDPDFISKLAHLYEFSSLVVNDKPTVFKKRTDDPDSLLLDDQIFFRRMFTQSTPYGDGVLVFKRPGVGKTCTISPVVENFKLSLIDNSKFKPAIVLVSNELLLKKFRDEVALKCTSDYFIENSEIFSERAKKIRLRKKLETTYKVFKWENFLKKIGELSVDEIRRRYSGRRIIVDESHHFRYFESPTDEQEKEKNFLYINLQKLFDNIDGSQKFLLSGTPMTNNANEIATQLNLILPAKERYPIGKNFDTTFFNKDGSFKTELKHTFISKLIGRISYLRAPVVDKVFMGTSIVPWTRFSHVVPVEMSQFQYESYSKIYAQGGAGVNTEPIRASISVGDIPNDFSEKSLQELKKTSNKFYETYRILKNAEKNKECVWIVCEYISDRYASLEALSKLLKVMGYSQITNANAMSSKGKRFIRIDGTSNSDKEIEDAIRNHNKPDNCYGDYNRVIIGGKRAKEGFSFSHIRVEVLLHPLWHKADENQYISRGIREGSLSALPADERYHHIYSLISVKPKFIENYALIKNTESDAELERFKENWETIDLHILAISESKEYKIAQITRLLKEVAFDCAANYNRNYREIDTDGTYDCDYTECKFTCYVPNGNAGAAGGRGYDPVKDFSKYPIDYSNYAILHSRSEITRLTKLIVELYSKEFAFSLEHLIHLLNYGKADHELFILLDTLDKIISERVSIYNRYGFECYLHEKNDVYYIADSLKAPAYELTDYVRYPIVIYPLAKYHGFDPLIQNFENETDVKLLKNGKFCDSPSQELFEQFSFQTQLSIIEKLFLTKDKLDKKSEMYKFYNEVVSKHFIEVQIPEFATKKNKAANVENAVIHRYLYLEKRRFDEAKFGKQNMKLVANGFTRIFDSKAGRWTYLGIEREKLLVEVLYTLRKQQNDTIDFKNGYGGIPGTEGELKIVTTKGRTGRVCKTMKFSELHKIVKTIGEYISYPEREKEIKDSISELKEALLDRESKLPFTPEELNNKSRSELVRMAIYQADNLSVDKLCDYLERVLLA